MTLAGCASVPRQEALPTYTIGGVSYFPLAAFCKARGVTFEYDPFTRTADLKGGPHTVTVMTDDTIALVDGSARVLRHPVRVYEDALVASYRFKEEFLDALFKEPAASGVCPLYGIRKVVVDAGHGGNDPGAIGRTGLREKFVTLDIAKRLASLLEAEGIEVVLTRSSDIFVPLDARVDTANRAKADLFVSIHANANRVRSLNGFEVYFVSSAVNDAEIAMNAAKSVPLGLEAYCAGSPSLPLKAILWDLIYTQNRAEAVTLARSVCRSAGRTLNARIIGVKEAKFFVLKGALMPAVLIETGFLSNPAEEKLLRNTYYRQKITEGILEGIREYAKEARRMEVVRR